MELYLQYFFFFFQNSQFQKTLYHLFQQKKALIEKGRAKVCRPCLIAENR